MNELKADAYAHPNAVKIIGKGYRMSPLAKLMNGTVEKAKLKPILQTDIIQTANYSLQPVYTPGHAEDHYCYFEKKKGWLFSGDLYVADKIKYFATYESLFTQIESIKKLVALDFDVLFCSHNPKVENGKKRLQNKLQFFEDFAGKVTKHHNEGKSVNEIFSLMNMKENYYYKVLTVGNFTAENMVKSVVKELKKKII